MKSLIFLMLMQQNALPTIDELRFTECIDLAATDPASAIVEGSQWRQEDGGWRADICLATGYSENFEFSRSIPYFESGAKAASEALEPRTKKFWLQAGNAAIAADQPKKAIEYIDRALAKGALANHDRAEALIDRARAYVASGQEPQAKTDLFAARRLAPQNSMGWLFSATLERRNGNLNDAQGFIATAASLAPKSPEIALEAGNIAAERGDDLRAKEHWNTVIKLAPQSRAANTARRLLGLIETAGPGL